MRFCIISDLHCKHLKDSSEKVDTLLISNSPRVPKNRHPVSSIIELIKRDRISADILICPGDLGDKADQQGITSSWTFLKEIKGSLNARLLVGVPGNHDINSRADKPEDIFSFIKNFDDSFPFEIEMHKATFWENGYCILIFEEVQFLLLNTVHDHFNPQKATESGMTEGMKEKIHEDLEKHKTNGNIKYRIAVLHHHPVQHSNISNFSKDTDLLKKGDILIDLLNEYQFQILIHGHKHQPRVVEVNSLPIIASGSFASIANLQATGINTMFHIVELNELSRKGHVYSWEYDIVHGWRNKLNDLFPPKIGFGATVGVNEIADSINAIFSGNGDTQMMYDIILEKQSEVQFLIPQKLVTLKGILFDKYGLKMSPEYPLEPSKVSKVIK